MIDHETGYKLCKHGHVRSPENTNAKGECRECCRAWSAKWMEKNRETAIERNAKAYQAGKDYYKKKSAKWKESNRESVSAINKRAVDRLTDYYVASKMGLKTKNAPPDMINLKREQLLLKRANKELKNAVKEIRGI